MMKTCPEHRHEHRDLPCPWPDCPNSEGATETFEVARHAGAGQMTQAEGHFQVAPQPRQFSRQKWECDKCGAFGYAWVEGDVKPDLDRCPHRRPGTVKPKRSR